uniref:Uncharacterized protein n=1 Tax=Anguilla anguilla TaxID=7936 RepID=A0A0E9SSG5_ANGAN
MHWRSNTSFFLTIVILNLQTKTKFTRTGELLLPLETSRTV